MPEQDSGEEKAGEREQRREAEEEVAERDAPQHVAGRDEAERAGHGRDCHETCDHLRPKLRGRAHNEQADDRRVDQGMKNANTAMITAAAGHGVVGESRKSGSGMATIASAASFSSGTFWVAC